MRHMKRGAKLGRTASHRKAMLANMAMSIIEYERIITTVPKAKEVRRLVERLITYGRMGTLAAIRQAARYVKDKTLLKKLFNDIAVAYKDRVGGYVRIIKTTERKGDNASLCIIELVGRAPVAVTAPSSEGRKKGKAAPAGETGGKDTDEGGESAKKPAKKVRKPKEEENPPAKKRGAKKGKAGGGEEE